MAEPPTTQGPLAGRYYLVRELGRGGMGVVYEAHDPRLERRVAIKLIAQTRHSPELREALLREARVVAKLDHPGIVPVHDLGEDPQGGGLFVVMPLVRGVTLRDLLAGRRLGIPATVAVAEQIAEVLGYSHAQGVIHRDIKPENVMVVECTAHDLKVKLMDFGLAVSPLDEQASRHGSVVGTVGYLSPEQVLGLPIDERSDLYGLGVLTFECLAGVLPFEPKSTGALPQMLWENAPRVSSLAPGTPPELDALVDACLHRDAACRPASAEEVWSVLRRLGEGMHEPLDLPLGGDVVAKVDEIQPTVGLERPLGSITRSLAETGVPTPTVGMGDLLLIHAEYAAARRAFAAERAARGRPPTCAEQIDDALRQASLAHKLARFDEAIEHCDEALARVAEAGASEPAGVACLHAWAGLVAVAAGWLPMARSRVGQAERAAESVELGPPRSRALTLALRARGNLLLAEARIREGIEMLQRALVHAEDYGEPWERSISRFNLGEAHALAGEHRTALHHLQLAELDKTTLGDRWGLSYLHRARGHIHLDRGELAEAELELRLGASLAKAIGDPKLMAMHGVDRARLLILQGHRERAFEQAEAARIAARRCGARTEQSAALALLARLRLPEEPEAALDQAREALETAPEGLAVKRASAGRALALAWAAKDGDEHANALLDEAEALVATWGHPVRRLDVEIDRLEIGVESRRPAPELEARARDCMARAEHHGAALHAARARVVLARIARARADVVHARAEATAAAAVFAERGATGLLDELHQTVPEVFASPES